MPEVGSPLMQERLQGLNSFLLLPVGLLLLCRALTQVSVQVVCCGKAHDKGPHNAHVFLI